jgi:cAMP-binding proteins - catabolite gene activator and regulatory subunit of cAMP-dependent protein kinases
MTDQQNTFLQLLSDVYPFSDLDTATLNLVLPYIERCRVPAGTRLFEAGEESEALYFILSGNVELYLPAKGKNKAIRIQNLAQYDHFGDDVILNRPRHTIALARTNLLLIKLSRENIRRISSQSSIINRIFNMFAVTYKNYCRTQFPWRQPAETAYLVMRPHPFFLWVKLIPNSLISLAIFSGLLFMAFTSRVSFIWIVLALLALSLGILFGVWESFAWANDYFSLTKDRVLIQKLQIGVFENRHETPMSAILSAGLDTSFLGRILGFGTVTARAYTGNLAIRHISDPDLVFSYLEYRRKCMLSDQRRQEKETMQVMLEKRMHPDQPTRPSPQIANDSPSHVDYYGDSLSDLLARFFTLRLEKDGAVIYRTHWWILLKKLFFPNLILLLAVVVTIARLLNLFALSALLVYAAALIVAVAGWLWWFYEYYDWRNDVYIIAADQLVDVNQHPLGSMDKRSAPVKNIQTVEYKRNGIIGMALNFGTVMIQIGNEELTFDDVYNPSAVQMEIFNRFREFNEHSRKMDQGRMTEWFNTYDRLRHDHENEP